VQWTDESGGAYGEDPYSGAGYAYGYGYAYNGSATGDMASMPQDPVQLAPWTRPTGNAYGVGTDPYATGTHLYATGPGPATTAWDVPHGDVLAVPPPELDTPGPSASGPDTAKSESGRPVFVDSSGRRQRLVLRTARLLVIPAGGYVALLISAVLGGPSLSAPFVPHSSTPHASAPDASPGAGHSAGSVRPAAVQEDSRPTAARKTSGSTDRSTSAAASAATPAPTAAPAGVASPTSTPTAVASAPRPSSKGRALGTSHKPAK
jgi:hypothetical protein